MPLPLAGGVGGPRGRRSEDGRGRGRGRRGSAGAGVSLGLIACPVGGSRLTQMRTNCSPACPSPPSQPLRVCLLPCSLFSEEGRNTDVLNTPAFLISLIALWKKGKEEECSSQLGCPKVKSQLSSLK